MAEIYLVRHGQASFNSENYDQLSDIGWQQSACLGAYFTERHIIFDQIYMGSQLRHSQTAEAILGTENNSYNVLPGLNEYDFSALYNAYMAQYPEETDAAREGDRRIFYRRLKLALKLWSQDQLTGDLPESWTEYKGRVGDALAHIRENSAGKCLVVSSGGPISMVMGHILDLCPQKIIDLNLQIKNASFCHIYSGQNKMQLSSFNNIPHLDQQSRFDTITFS